MLIGAIWAQTVSGVIGNKGDMPWHLPEDLKHFSQVTKNSTVLMGRKTWESLPEKFRPLPHRENYILSNSGYRAEGATTFSDIETALAHAQENGAEKFWFIGGGQVYLQSLPYLTTVERTVIDTSVEGDTFSPSTLNPDFLTENFKLVEQKWWETSSTGLLYNFETYQRKTG